jgi:hypothetical protein
VTALRVAATFVVTSLLSIPVVIVLGVVLVIVIMTSNPPRAGQSLVPEVVGVVVRWDFVKDECAVHRYTLDTGQTVDVRDILPGSSHKCGDGPWLTGIAQLSASRYSLGSGGPGKPVVDGGLLYYGRDRNGQEWVAGAYRSTFADSGECPYRLQGTGYDEGPILHFSNGLVIAKAPGFKVAHDWVDNPGLFRDRDTICVNARGEALMLSHFLYH